MPSSAPIRPDATRARYETLLDVAESIAAHRQLSTLFADLSRCLNSLVSFDFIALTLVDANQQVSRLHILQTDKELVGAPPLDAPLDQPPTGAALAARLPVYVADLEMEERFPFIRPLLHANGIQSICVVPLFRSEERRVGKECR